MNIVIPQITGFTATKIIRKTDKKVLIIAQSSILEHPNKFKDAGFNDYLIKPFSPDDFLKIFQKHLKY